MSIDGMKKQIVEVRGVRIGEGRPKIIVPVVGENEKEIMEQAELLSEAEYDIVEWRADCIQGDLDYYRIEGVLAGIRKLIKDKPVLFTFRTQNEGGSRPVELYVYERFNRQVAAAGLADIIDVEIFSGDEPVKRIISAAHTYGVRVIASNHEFDCTPDRAELIYRLIKMQRLGADISKIAVMPKDRQDVLTLLSATEEMVRCYADRPLITMSMSSEGLISRLCGEVFGSDATFGAVGKGSAPGQIDVRKLKSVLDIIHESMGG